MFSADTAAAMQELQARLAATPDAFLELHDAVLRLPDFYIERAGGIDFFAWDEETTAQLGHRIKVDDANGRRIVKVERRGRRGKGRDDLALRGA
ncbi:hypothetical protein MKK84_19300 [Methylobacterium sp. E-065]|uniref:hypothetical protein n=1 Tax=Methylobacterium sp. E-065 TaxID=2836583 RepID=UPI001FBAE10E|nr:hypothetical protein [Methylobacterium sp. E-065]MCJ2019554.1 hypothetical protein [Methylobacterium sp. E-065]